MALYLPRGGDYERALRYVSQANGIAGAMEGASQGLALVMNIQKIADNALNMEMKQEQFAENRAKAAADLYGRLDSLQGGLSDVVGDDGEGSVATGRAGRRAGGRAGRSAQCSVEARQARREGPRALCPGAHRWRVPRLHPRGREQGKVA